MTAPAAIFDLDGTLAETVGDLVATTNAVLAPYGIPPIDAEASRNSAGMGGIVLMRLAFSRAGKQVPDETLNDLFPQFDDHYRQNLSQFSHLYAGVEAALSGMRQEGFRLGVCTNKPEEPTLELLKRLRIADKFDSIIGGDTLSERKPHPMPLLEAVRRAEGISDRAVMIGDSEVDLNAARAAGVPCILVRFGYSPVPVENLGADALVDSFGEIPEKISELLAEGAALGRENAA